MISAAFLSGVKRIGNFRDFGGGGGESNDNADQAVFFLAMSCSFLCCSIISAKWRVISVNFENIASVEVIAAGAMDWPSIDCSKSSSSACSSSSSPPELDLRTADLSANASPLPIYVDLD